jgi:putative colanic acid biosynthesis acetyltransferase WcaF
MTRSQRLSDEREVWQDLSAFTLPANFRGRPAWFVQLWWLVQGSLFRGSPQFAYGYRRALLRLFGTQVGHDVLIRPSVTITYPWKVVICDGAWIGDDVVLYSLGDIYVGRDTVISQRSYVCAADHDHLQPNFPIRARPIRIDEQVWIGTDVFVGPGVHIAAAAVVGARSSVFRDLPREMVCTGSPCRPVRPRKMLPKSLVGVCAVRE